MERKWKKMQEDRAKLQPTNRAQRRKAARLLAGHDGDTKAVYRALKNLEER